MQQSTEEYRGVRITVTPRQDHDDLWDYEYQLEALADVPVPDPARKRSGTAGGHTTPAAALESGTQVARIEVDNLLALAQPAK